MHEAGAAVRRVPSRETRNTLPNGPSAVGYCHGTPRAQNAPEDPAVTCRCSERQPVRPSIGEKSRSFDSGLKVNS